MNSAIGLDCLIKQAAEIEDLKARLVLLEEVAKALKPFALLAIIARLHGHKPGSTCEYRLYTSDIFRAEESLSALDKPAEGGGE